MGMFDYIQLEVDLPDGTSTKGREFQTKSLDSTMSNYVITANGEIYMEAWDYEWVEDESHFLKGYLNRIEGTYRREYLTDIHQDVIFYDGRKQGEKWRDYYARFTNGKLEKMWYKDCDY